MTQEELMKARRAVGLPTKMRVRHEKYGECFVWAFCRIQAEMAACVIWKCDWETEHKKMHIRVTSDQSGYEEACAV